MQKSNMKYNNFLQLHTINCLHSDIYIKYFKGTALLRYYLHYQIRKPTSRASLRIYFNSKIEFNFICLEKNNTVLSPYIHSFTGDLQKNDTNYGTCLLLHTCIPLSILHLHVLNIQLILQTTSTLLLSSLQDSNDTDNKLIP